MNTNNEISGILSLVLIGLMILLFGLIIVYVVLKLRNRAKEQIRNEKQGIVKEEINEKKERKYRTIAMFGAIMAFFLTVQIWFPYLPLYGIAFMLGTCLLRAVIIGDEKEDYRSELIEAEKIKVLCY